MNESCLYIPTIKVGNKEVDSQLFKELTIFTQNREISIYIWGLTRIPEFMSTLKGIKYDANGEPTLESLDKAINISSYLEGGMTIKGALMSLNAIDNKGNSIVHKSYNDIIDSVIKFNKDNPKFVADIEYKDGGYVITVNKKTTSNINKPNELIFNNSLNNQLRSILRSLGFDVEVLDTPKFAAKFSPKDAKTTFDGLKTVIQIVKGQLGEELFPEEFSHLMIEGLINHPLVKRLVDSLKDEDILKNILKDEYDRYTQLYNNDVYKLQKEAAGKLLQNHITNRNQSVDRQSLLQRIWNFIKDIFNKISDNTLDRILEQANNTADKIASSILDGSVIPLIDKNAILNADTFYSTKEELNGLEKLAHESLELASRRLKILRDRSKSGKYNEEDLKAIKELQEYIKEKKYSKSCISFLTSSLNQLRELNDRLKILNADEIDEYTDSDKLRLICSTLRDIKTFSDAYEPIIKQMMDIESLSDADVVDLTAEDAKIISNISNSIFKIINSINNNYKNMRYNVLYNFLKSYWGEDKIVNIGKHKGDVLTLSMIMDHADKDINFIDNYINSMSDASDPLLSLIDKVVKTTQSQRDARLEKILSGVRTAHKKLIDAGYTTDFMYERDEDGKLTGRIISNIDFVKYNKERNEELQRLKDEGYEYWQIKQYMDKWENEHTVLVVVDADIEKEERLPNSRYDVPDSKRVENILSEEQYEYYKTMIQLKSALDSFLPNQYTNLYRAVQIRNDVLEGILDNINNPKEASKIILENLKDNFIRRSDDVDFVSDSPLDDTKYEKVNLDFSGNPINRLPIYYTTPLEDPSRLSTDFTSSILAYAGMAFNYNEMSKVIDALELAREFVLDRDVKQTYGDNILAEVYKVVGVKYSREYSKKGKDTNIGSRINAYYDMNIYNHRKKEGKKIEILGAEADTEKILDAVKNYTGIVGLGINLFAGISNITMGKLQMLIEGVSGEYYGKTDLMRSIKDYYKLLPDYMRELNSTVKTNKLALLIDKFNALEEFYNNLKDERFYKGPMSKILGSTNIYFLNNIGEHYLHSRNMLAFLNATKVLNSENQEISLIDAFEVKQTEDNEYYIALKEGTKDLNGELLSTEGLESGSDLYNEIDDRFNSYITSLKLKIGKVSQSMNGAFNEMDKGSINRYGLGRLVLQFRQWMPAHYNRRYASTYYDASIGKYREGYYRTFGRFITNTIKELSKGKFQLVTNWESLNKDEKANCMRAFTELLGYMLLAVIDSLLGSTKDKEGMWGKRMALYQLKRLKLEIGASIPWFTLFTNAKEIIQQPAAAVNTMDNLIDVLKIWNMTHEIESGRYKGYSQWEKDFYQALPFYNQIRKITDLTEEEYMYAIFNR